MEPIAGKLVKRTSCPPNAWVAGWVGSHGVWSYRLFDTRLAAFAFVASKPEGRVWQCSDAPPQLPDREKLAKWLFENSCLYPPAIEWEDLSGGVVESCFKNADAVLALLRDGIPAELMPD